MSGSPIDRAAAPHATPRTQAERDAVGAKIDKLVAEGKTREQAVTEALSMFRAGRIGPQTQG
ncbi:MAG TPA: hypothetical protein VI911_04315 [Patescibacteria group bacterium]|nr:hypothetical protein [Patescibacteria group bacterium]